MVRPYHAIPIVECGEPLIPIPDRFARVDPRPIGVWEQTTQGDRPLCCAVG